MPARTIYYTACTLDGFIADPQETLSWLTGFEPAAGNAGEGLPMRDRYPAFFEGIGALSMGARTYEFIEDADYWPYGEMQAWVYTHRELDRIEQASGLHFTSGDIADEHQAQLEAAGEKDLWVLGGGDLASQYANAGLLDLVTLTVVPIALGEGFPLFATPLPKPMRLLGSMPFENGMVELSYEIVR